MAYSQNCQQNYEKEIQPLLRANQLAQALTPAQKLAEKCPDFYPIQATYADLLWENGDSIAALQMAKALINKFPNEKRPYQQLVRKLAESSLFKEAVEVINQFDEKFKNQTHETSWLKKVKQVKWAANQPAIEMMGGAKSLPASINTSADEGLACINPLENILFFTRRSGVHEKLFKAEQIADTVWRTQELLIPDAGNRLGAHTLSADGSTLIFTACDRPDSRGRCDLYESVRNKEGLWSVPRNLGSAINTPSWESQPSLSFDGKILIFSSTREGGKGGSDLWMSFFNNGEWSTPSNLSDINTSGDEKSPFLHADGKTLFFASNGREESFGNLDLYFTHFDSEVKRWSAPINLGASVNSPFNESGLTFNTRGNRGFINRFQPGKGEDLFEINLSPAWNVPNMSLLNLRGNWVSNNDFNWTLVDLKSGLQLPDQWIKLNDTSLLVVYDVSKPHALLGTAPGFMPVSIHLTDSVSTIMSKMVMPEPIKAGQSLTLSNIFFESNSYQLNQMSESELDFIADWMKVNDKWSFEIAGYTDNQGKQVDNQLLSLKRAEVVKVALVKRGIPTQRLKCYGFGAQFPIADNLTEKGRAKNRRTVLKISKQF